MQIPDYHKIKRINMNKQKTEAKPNQTFFR